MDTQTDTQQDKGSRPWKAILVALLAGVLLGGTLAVTQPAIAAAPLKWGKIWKQEIKPRADKRYYTKKKSKQRYYTKANTERLFEPKVNVLRGVYAITGTAGAAGENHFSDAISFGRAFAAAPIEHYVPSGDAVPTGCTGTAANPGALPGHLCFFEETSVNVLEVNVLDIQDSAGQANTMGAVLQATSLDVNNLYVFGSWAAAPPA